MDSSSMRQDSTVRDSTAKAPAAVPAASGHQLSLSDPDNPMNWAFHKKLYVTAVAFAFGWAVAFGITSHTAGITEIITTFNATQRDANLSFSIIFFGIALAPIWVPHATERFGRAPVYLLSLPIFSLFILGVSASNNWSSVLACRFFAGVFGGPCLVLIEGTFADVWSAESTASYYSVLSLASYTGAGAGPLIGGYVFEAMDWRWPPRVTLMIALAAYLFGIGMPETYGRKIIRARGCRTGMPITLAPAQSGVTIGEMATHTLINPLKMLVTEPIVIACSLYLGLNFAVVFQWFITVPAVLFLTYDFSVSRAGLAFIGAIGGAICSSISSVLLERLANSISCKPGSARIESRLFSAMLGSVLVCASLFWIGWTADPKFSFYIPITGTAIYVWGNMSVLTGLISYLFDAYPPAGTLSALTAAACFRLICAGIVPIFILDMVVDLTGAWAFSTFGIISAVMIPIPVVLYLFGPQLRKRSSFGGGMSTVDMEMMARENVGGSAPGQVQPEFMPMQA